MEPIIATQDLKKVYRLGRVDVPALRGVDLDVHAGELLMLVGPSGSGKTTLLSMLGTLLKPSEGEIRLDGKILSAMAENQLPGIRQRR